MNGLTLRVNPSNKKMKNSMGFPPVVLPNDASIEIKNELFKEFIKSNTTDEQLTVVKAIVESIRDNCDPVVMKFMSLVFLQAPPKHPVKCFVTRHITKNERFQQPFSEELAKEIKNLTMKSLTEYPQYVDVVSKIATCIENFPAGALAIQTVEIELAEHLNNCLDCCIKTLREVKLAPTEKNEIYNLSHLALRLLLHVVQKVRKDHASTIMSMFKRLRIFIKSLIFDEDAPMDTKSLCGILFLTMELMESGPNAWIGILDPSEANEDIKWLLQHEAGQLSLYSAIATVVPVDRIEAQTVSGQSAVVYLTEKIIDIGERFSSESTFILGVTRTVVQISKLLGKVRAAPAAALAEQVLAFAWGHLDHHMDSVRHLTAQALANVVRHCTNLQAQGDESGVERLFAALGALDRGRKSYYVSLTALTAQLGAAHVLRRLPGVIGDAMDALGVQAVQASASTALATLLRAQVQAAAAGGWGAREQWLAPAVARVRDRRLDAHALAILEDLLAQAVALDDRVFDYIVPHIRECAQEREGLACALVLLSAARRAPHAPHWQDLLAYELLERAAIDAVDEVRILSLSLVAESRRSTEPFRAADLALVRHFLHYNANAQAPHLRQLTLSLMKKFTKRLEDSYRALARSPGGAEHYTRFAEQLRAQCFSSLAPGANYSRRCVALQLLAWLASVRLGGHAWEWKKEYVEKLLLRLEDSYEGNKALALQVLNSAPPDLLRGKQYRVSLDIDDILREASSMKPTDCVSAAYKLSFIKNNLPELILQGNDWSAAEAASLALSRRLAAALRAQLAECRRGLVRAARRAPMYGLVHCLGRLLDELDADAISEDPQWTALVEEILSTCMEASACVASVVNSASPEGHLPADAAGLAVSDHGNTGDVILEDGRPVTAQMVLLCAWRTVKEVSLLLGSALSRLSIAAEGAAGGSVSARTVARAGRHFTRLLSRTQHRGAFEQAYVGFTRLLARLWRSRSAALHALPRAWLRALTAAVAAPRARSATRRSAGLPFMIQALVTTELQVHGNPKCLHECITTLLRLARATSVNSTEDPRRADPDDPDAPGDAIDADALEDILTEDAERDSADESTLPDSIKETSNDKLDNSTKSPFNSMAATINSTLNLNDSIEESEAASRDHLVETRTHSLNILRALFRNSMLEESVAGYVGEGLMVALQGFEADTWMERNSATLLFSALMVRAFGVARERRADTPALRNTMTGRIFFLRYPRLYDFILNKLKEAEASLEEQLQPALFAVLVLLGRLYPSALEGTASALRLAALAPPARSCARARVLAARRLAARALVPLCAPDRYIPQLSALLRTLGDARLRRNHCHGALLQASRLLRARTPPAPLAHARASDTLWILAQARGPCPCYVIADEYVKMIDLIIWRFPSFLDDEMLTTIKGYLHEILFTDVIPLITAGREVCLANCLSLYFVILNKMQNTADLPGLIYKGLDHKSYEVVLSALNYLLILYNKLDVEDCRFQQHLYSFKNENVLSELRDSPLYIEKLCKILKNNKYLECIQKTLRVLILERDTQKYIVGVKTGDYNACDEEIIKHLFDFIQNEHENFTHLYLESLSNFVSEKLDDLSIPKVTVLEVIRVVYTCSSSENSDTTRDVAVGFMERNFCTLLECDLHGLHEDEKFEWTSTLWASLAMLLEDDECALRQRAADVAARAAGERGGVLPARAASLARGRAAREPPAAALLALLALLDFRAEVRRPDEIGDECRVFDQNERYNIFLEEFTWTEACADEILQVCAARHESAAQLVQSLVDDAAYKGTFDKLCNDNVTVFRKMIKDRSLTFKTEVVNPKIELFINKLCS